MAHHEPSPRLLAAWLPVFSPLLMAENKAKIARHGTGWKHSIKLAANLESQPSEESGHTNV
jgi:hypothetical protein